MRKAFAILGLLLFSSCYYSSEYPNGQKEPIAVSVPTIIGDMDGGFNYALARALNESGKFHYSRVNGEYLLEVKLVGDAVDRVGFSYDRDPVSGDLRKNLIGTENRRTISAEIQVVDAVSRHVLLGPQIINADTVYDYVDSDNLYDLSFIDAAGGRVTVLDFSLGQLDTIEGGQDASLQEIYQMLAEKVVEGMITQKWAQGNKQHGERP